MKRAFPWVVAIGVGGLIALQIGLHASREVAHRDERYRSIILVDPDGKEVRLEVEVADEPGEWEQGLMHRSEVTHGMLFVYPGEQMLTFWMKNTLVPLDILFFDADGALMSSGEMVPCTADPCPTYSSERPAQYALEIPAEFREERNIGEGWGLRFPAQK